MKKQGKVKSIPVTREQVERAGVFLVDSSVYQNAPLGITLNECDVEYLVKNLYNVKTLVVEYEEYNGHAGLVAYPIKQLPLKYSQWKSAIDNGEVDSDKVVEFEIIKNQIQQHACEWCEGKGCGACKNSGNSHRTYAKIIPQKKRMYSEEELMTYAWYAVQWCSKMSSKEPNKVIHRRDMEEYLKNEIY